MEPPKQGEAGQAAAFSNHILIQRLNKEVNVGDWASSESPGFRILFIWKSQLLQSSPLLDFCPGIQRSTGYKGVGKLHTVNFSPNSNTCMTCVPQIICNFPLYTLPGNRQTPEHSGKSWFQDLGTWTLFWPCQQGLRQLSPNNRRGLHYCACLLCCVHKDSADSRICCLALPECWNVSLIRE